jgi:antitoxin component YwqK of YwqJK toxin-antitoxin module
MLGKISHFIRFFGCGILHLCAAHVIAQNSTDYDKLQVFSNELESSFHELYEAPEGRPDLKHGVYNLLCKDLLVIDGFYHKSKRQDTWSYFYLNGILYAQGKYLNDQKHGVWEYYTTKGKLSSYGGYVLGQRRGVWKGYYYSGQLAFEGTYLTDSTFSDFTMYNLSGTAAITRTFEYYDSTVYCHEHNFHTKGNQKYEFRCELDLRNPGTLEAIRRSGGMEAWLLESQTLSNLNVNDQIWIMNGPVKRWYSNGMMASHQVYVDNKLVGIYGAQDMWGNAITECQLHEGNGHWLQHGENQKTRFEADYLNGLLQGEATLYHDNGNISLKAVFHEGKPDSVWVGYFEDASDRVRMTFHDGDSVFVEQTIHANKAVRSGWVVCGDKEGPWIDMDFLGDTIAIRTYDQEYLNGLYAEFNQGVRLKEGNYSYGLRSGNWHSSNMRGKTTWVETYDYNVAGVDLTQPLTAGVHTINPDLFHYEFERVPASAYEDLELELYRSPHIDNRPFADSSYVLLALIIGPEGELEDVHLVRDVQGKGAAIVESVKKDYPYYNSERFLGLPVRRKYYVEVMLSREKRALVHD